ncbi:50S ribosomal protein L9 [Patescibacteria group bacterium]|nr:50S ribosomal protein L9 [Patescibacteria group bacterium]
MKVILLQDVAKIGRRHTVVEVPDGFARNRLIPSKLAVPATKDMMGRYKAQRDYVENEKKLQAASLSESLKTLEQTTVTVTAEANEKGHLFKQVSKEMIAAATVAAGAPIAAGAMVIDVPVKELGEHTIAVKQGDVKGEFTVTVVAA